MFFDKLIQEFLFKLVDDGLKTQCKKCIYTSSDLSTLLTIEVEWGRTLGTLSIYGAAEEAPPIVY